MVIRECIDQGAIRSTYEVMSVLRPHVSCGVYVSLLSSLITSEGYRLIGMFDAEECCQAVAGFRMRRSLFRGGCKELCLDDLVVLPVSRSQGLGSLLLQWLKDEAIKLDCVGIVADSGIQRTQAHAFYKREGFDVMAYHFFCPVEKR